MEDEIFKHQREDRRRSKVSLVRIGRLAMWLTTERRRVARCGPRFVIKSGVLAETQAATSVHVMTSVSAAKRRCKLAFLERRHDDETSN
ncbi:hypothetical protein E4U22_001135 [Claviceps purpurea]|nr:hypothetical protein E4U22_001135 [Claviceps purpurea]